MPRSGHSGLLTVAVPDNELEVHCRPLSLSHLDYCARQVPHHVPQEAVGLESEASAGRAAAARDRP